MSMKGQPEGSVLSGPPPCIMIAAAAPDLVQRMPDMWRAIGVRWSVVQHKRAAVLLAGLELPGVQLGRAAREVARLPGGSIGPHWELSLRQVHRRPCLRLLLLPARPCPAAKRPCAAASSGCNAPAGPQPPTGRAAGPHPPAAELASRPGNQGAVLSQGAAPARQGRASRAAR